MPVRKLGEVEMAISEKAKTILKWCPSDQFRNEYDRIFGKKDKDEKSDTDNKTKKAITK